MAEERGQNNEQAAPAYSLFGKLEKRYIVVLVAFAGWFSTLSSFIYYPVIHLIAKDLNVSVNKINLTVTSYMVVSSFAPALVGDAADMLGRRPIYLITLTVYLISNMSIALQNSFAALLCLRMLQSAGISGKQLSKTTFCSSLTF
jgi:MFS family permease